MIEAVRRGRQAEFVEFGWQNEVPDPQDAATFKNSKLRGLDYKEPHHTLRRFYQMLLRFRQDNQFGASADWLVIADDKRKMVKLIRARNSKTIAIIFNFAGEALDGMPKEVLELDSQSVPGPWAVAFCSSDAKWLGPGATSGDDAGGQDSITLSPQSFLVLQRDENN